MEPSRDVARGEGPSLLPYMGTTIDLTTARLLLARYEQQATQHTGADFEDERILDPSWQRKVSCGSCHVSSSHSPFHKGKGLAVVESSSEESSDEGSSDKEWVGFNEGVKGGSSRPRKRKRTSETAQL